jgi:hypothetical protein
VSMRLSLYLIAGLATLVYLHTLHAEARWLADVRSEAIQAENDRVHKALLQHPDIWIRIHPMTYADLCHAYVRVGTIDATYAGILIHEDTARLPEERMVITYPNGTVPVITGKAEPRPAATTTTEL